MVEQTVWLLVEHHRDLVAKFHPVDGTVELRERKHAEGCGALKTSGWALLEGEDASAVYSDGYTLFFQNGTQLWNLGDPDIRLDVIYGQPNLFRITQNGQCLFEKRYVLPEVPFDPTWDSIDQGSLDFYYRMAECMEGDAARWVREAAKHLAPSPTL